MDKDLKQYLWFSCPMQVLISLMYLGQRIADGMPTGEAVGKFIFAASLCIIVQFAIVWIVATWRGSR